MPKHLSHSGGGGRGPWATPKSGELPSPASKMAADSKPLKIIQPKLALRSKVGPTHGISKRMTWGS